MSDQSAELALRNASVVHGLGRGETWALRETCLRIPTGQLLLITGPSGSGKTTLLSLLGCLMRPSSGTVHVRGIEAGSLDESRRTVLRQKYIGFVFQSFRLFPALSVIDNVLLGSQVVSGAILPISKAAELLGELGLGNHMRQKTDALSGGEKQRVAIARAIVKDPAIVLADEPTACLDAKSGADICRILRGLTVKDKKTVVVASHDLRWRGYADRVVTICDGVVSDEEELDR